MEIIRKFPLFSTKRLSYIRKLAYSSTSSQDTVISIYGPDHLAIQESLKKLIEKEINPFVDKWEKEKIFPAHEVFKKLGKAGFLGANKETKYGGLGLDFSYNMAIAEQLGEINCGGIPMAIGAHSDLSTAALSRFGSHELKQEFLAPTIAGDIVACLGVSEVGSGSDVASVRTTAKTDGDDLIINGGKMWTTNGAQADWMCLLANTGSGPAHQNKSLICLPLKTKGVTVSRTIDKIGMWSSDTAETFFEDVRIPKRYIIGEEGKGFTYQMFQFQEERLFAVALCLLPLEKVIQDTIAYAKDRRIYGRPLIDNQVVHFRLAELLTELESLKSLVYRAVGDYVYLKKDVTLLASMAKLKAGRLCREIPDACLQYYGGMGFTQDMLVSRCWRDMRLMSIGGGADEVMLSIICKYMKTLPKS